MIDRPIYNSLPSIYALFHNRVEPDKLTDSAYLVEYWENIYKDWNETLDSIINFNGDYSIFTAEQLDYLSFFFGFSDDWYNPIWTNVQKVNLFMGVYKEPYIWKHRGSKVVFDFVAKALDIPTKIAPRTGWIVNVSIVGISLIGSQANGLLQLVIPTNYLDFYQSQYEIRYMRQWVPKHIHTITVLNPDETYVPN